MTTFSYDVGIAKIFGISTAIYLAYIQLLVDLNDNNDVQLSLSKMDSVTGLDSDKIIQVENQLISYGILSKKQRKGIDKYRVIVNWDVLADYISKNNKQLAEKYYILNCAIPTNFNKEPKNRLTKRDKMYYNIKNSIEEDNPVIQQLLFDWIDRIQSDPRNFVFTQASAQININELKEFSNNNPDIESEVLKIAIKRSIGDLSNAIKIYRENQRNNSMNDFASYSEIKSTGEETSEEVF